MSDRSYRNGITVDSVINMLDDIHGVYAGNIKYIRLPQPIDGIGPADGIKFSTLSNIRSEKLLRSNTVTGSPNPSRRVFSHRLSQARQDDHIYEHRSGSDRQRSPMINSINIKINDAIRYANNMLPNEYDPIIDEEEESVANAEAREFADPIVDVPSINMRRRPVRRHV